MKARWAPAAALAAAVALVAVPAGAAPVAHHAVVLSGTASAGPGDSATLNMNSSGGGLLFFRVQAPAGKQLDSISVSGVQCRIVNGQGGCGPFSPPVTTQPITAVVHSPQGLSPADGPFNSFGTDNGTTDDGPFVIPWQVPEPEPCECEDLSVAMKAKDAYTSAAELAPTGDKLARFGGMITWTLSCTAGEGECDGEIALQPPKKSDVKLTAYQAVAFVPKKGTNKGKTLYKPGKKIPLVFTCGPADCDTTTQGHFFLKADSKHDLLPGPRAGKKFSFRFVTSCGDEEATELITIVFKANGDLDRKKGNLRK